MGEGGGRKRVRKHVTRASLRSARIKTRKIMELHFNLHTTVSINTVNLFIYCTISIVYKIIMNTSY